MDEYIKREAVIDLITRRYENPEICMQEINSIPAADVATVMHAQWIEDESGIIICPKCKRGYNLIAKFTNYCPACGAKMDGGDSNAKSV
jgi:hypothetical protein